MSSKLLSLFVKVYIIVNKWIFFIKIISTKRTTNLIHNVLILKLSKCIAKILFDLSLGHQIAQSNVELKYTIFHDLTAYLTVSSVICFFLGALNHLNNYLDNHFNNYIEIEKSASSLL